MQNGIALLLCFLQCLEFTTVSNGNLASGTSRVRTIALNLTDNLHTLNNLAENNVLAIQPGSLDSANEELGAVGVGTGIGHRQDTRAFVLQGEVLVSELFAVDAATTGTVVAGEVTALAHEVGNDAVEGATLEGQAVALFSSAQGAEVFDGAGDDVGAEFHDDTAESGTVSSHIEEDTRVGHT